MESLLPLKAILQRELITTLRRPTVYAVMAATVLWGGAAMLYVSAGAGPGSRASEVGVYGLLVNLAMASVVLLTPVAALSFVREREEDTWVLLYTTLIPAWQLVLGKLLSILLVYVLVLVAVLPVFGLVFFFLGVGVVEVAVGLVFLLLAAALNVAMGLSFSVHRDSPADAVVMSVPAAAGLQLGVLMGSTLCGLMLTPLLFITPIPEPVFVLLYPAVYFAFTGLMCMQTVKRIRCAPQEVEIVPYAVPAPGMTASPQRFRSENSLPTDPAGAIRDGANAIFERERGSCTFASRERDGLAGFLAFIVVTVVSVIGGLGAEGQYLLFTVQSVLFLLLAPAAPILSVQREHDRGSRDLLRATPLQSGEILRGILLYGGWRLRMPAAGAIAWSIFPIAASLSQPLYLLFWAAAVLVHLVSILCVMNVAIISATLSRSPLVAMSSIYLLMLIVFLLAPALLTMLELPVWPLSPHRALHATFLGGYPYRLPLSLALWAVLAWLAHLLAISLYRRKCLWSGAGSA